MDFPQYLLTLEHHNISFVLKYSVSDYKAVLSKSGVDSSSRKNIAVVIHEI